MDTTSYKALLSNTKLSLSKSLKVEVAKQTFSVYFTNVLEDCATCIYQVITLYSLCSKKPVVNSQWSSKVISFLLYLLSFNIDL